MISEIKIENKTDKAFKKVTRILFTIGVVGQMMFAFYIVVFFGGVAINGTYEKVNEQLMHGIVEGDGMGNFMLAVHLALAAVITLGGPIQFFSSIRNRYPAFHRWNGRFYFVTAFLISIAGLYMIWTRGAHGGIIMALGNTLNATLIMSFSVMAWRTAIQRNFTAHKKWAIRAFLMVSGVWFFRIGYGLWILLTGFTVPGSNENLNGPFDIFLAYAHSLVPLLILELYFFAKTNNNLRIKKIATIGLGILSVLLAAGIIMVAMIFWIPVL